MNTISETEVNSGSSYCGLAKYWRTDGWTTPYHTDIHRAYTINLTELPLKSAIKKKRKAWDQYKRSKKFNSKEEIGLKWIEYTKKEIRLQS